MGRTDIEPEVTETDTVSLQKQVAALSAQVGQLTKAAAASGGISADALEQMLARVTALSAEAYERTQHPDNREHPGISVYSYPEGDKARPRPNLKCKMLWVGYDLTIDTLMATEIELLNRAEPGRFRFTRTDGSQDWLNVEATVTDVGSLERLQFTFLTAERKDTLPSMVGMLREAFKVKSPEQIELDTLRAEVERLKTQPVGAG